MKPTIVVGYSPDEFGAVGVERALEEARLRDARVLVVNASRGDAYVDEHFASTEQLRALEEQLSSSGVDCEVRQSFGHDVAEQVLGVIEETGAILVVLGIRRRSPVGKLLMGSVAQKVLLGAECAVLAVKPPRWPPSTSYAPVVIATGAYDVDAADKAAGPGRDDRALLGFCTPDRI